MGLNGSTNEEKIWNYLKQHGLSDYGCAGLMGNLYVESKLNPKNMQNSYEGKLGFTDEAYCNAVDNGSYQNFVNDKVGFGLAQWTHHSRKLKLIQYANMTARSIGDLEMQLEFLTNEIAKGYKTVFTTLKNAKSVREASDAVLIKYEKPADQSETSKQKRAEYGLAYFEKYASLRETEVIPMKIKVNDLIELFEKMYKEHWSYVWGAARKGCVDCSGAFVYAYKLLANAYIYHGSNRIARKYVGDLQTIDKAKAGYAAFKWKKKGAPTSYTDGKGNYYHIGLVDCSGKYVLNAKGVSSGFCKDAIDSWDYVAPLHAVDYSGEIVKEDKETEECLYLATVVTDSGKLNLRRTPGGNRIGKLERNTTVEVLDDSNSKWWYVRQNATGQTGYASTDYLRKITSNEESGYTVRVTVNTLNVREGAGTNYRIIGKIKDKGVYTIIEEADGQGASKWLRLTSGGWIASDYCE